MVKALEPIFFYFQNPTAHRALFATALELRRIQVVTGEGRVRDLLITEFVLN